MTMTWTRKVQSWAVAGCLPMFAVDLLALLRLRAFIRWRWRAGRRLPRSVVPIAPVSATGLGREPSEDPARRPLAQSGPRASRRQCLADQGHLPRRPLPTPGRPARQETRPGRSGTLDPHLGLAQVHPRHRLRRPRWRLLPRTHRPGQAAPTPGEPAQPTRLPSDPPSRRSCLTSANGQGAGDFRIRRLGWR